MAEAFDLGALESGVGLRRRTILDRHIRLQQNNMREKAPRLPPSSTRLSSQLIDDTNLAAASCQSGSLSVRCSVAW